MPTASNEDQPTPLILMDAVTAPIIIVMVDYTAQHLSLDCLVHCPMRNPRINTDVLWQHICKSAPQILGVAHFCPMNDSR